MDDDFELIEKEDAEGAPAPPAKEVVSAAPPVKAGRAAAPPPEPVPSAAMKAATTETKLSSANVAGTESHLVGTAAEQEATNKGRPTPPPTCGSDSPAAGVLCALSLLASALGACLLAWLSVALARLRSVDWPARRQDAVAAASTAWTASRTATVKAWHIHALPALHSAAECVHLAGERAAASPRCQAAWHAARQGAQRAAPLAATAAARLTHTAAHVSAEAARLAHAAAASERGHQVSALYRRLLHTPADSAATAAVDFAYAHLRAAAAALPGFAARAYALLCTATAAAARATHSTFLAADARTRAHWAAACAQHPEGCWPACSAAARLCWADVAQVARTQWPRVQAAARQHGGPAWARARELLGRATATSQDPAVREVVTMATVVAVVAVAFAVLFSDKGLLVRWIDYNNRQLPQAGVAFAAETRLG